MTDCSVAFLLVLYFNLQSAPPISLHSFIVGSQSTLYGQAKLLFNFSSSLKFTAGPFFTMPAAPEPVLTHFSALPILYKAPLKNKQTNKGTKEASEGTCRGF